MTLRSTICTQNATIACTPPPTLSIQGKTKDGFKTASQKTQLLELEVVFEGVFPVGQRHLAYMSPGMKVYVNHENTTQEWMKRTFTLEEKEFILVPSQYILMSRTVSWDDEVGSSGLASESQSRPLPPPVPEVGSGG